MVVWDEPAIDDGNERKSCTEAQAINITKRVAAKRGYTYKTDQEALEDFLTVHWAWIVDETSSTKNT